MDPVKLQKLFSLSQIGIGVAFLFLVLWMRRPRDESGFAVRESDREAERKQRLSKLNASGARPSLADAKLRKKNPEAVLLLEGIRLDGAPHEILGVPASAGRSEIQKAFRELMKRFHPDKIGPPGSREWQEAQKIAQTIIQAKDELLKTARD